MGKPKVYSIQRCEPRLPMEVAVQIAGNSSAPGVEMTFTENVSSRGARVVTSRRWTQNDQVVLASMRGDFHALARVAYCHTVRNRGFAIGLEFVRPNGRWVVNAPLERQITPHR